MNKETKKAVRKLIDPNTLQTANERVQDVEDILDRLKSEFDMRYELLFKDGNIVHLHSAETIKGIANWIIDNSGIGLTSYELDSFDGFSDDILRMKEYLVVAGHLNSPVAPKPKQRDSCGEVSS